MTEKEPPFGMFEELPDWVWDVVLAMEKYEEEHPSLLPAPILDTSGGQTYVDVRKACCINHILERVPMEVRMVARHLKRYKDNG